MEDEDWESTALLGESFDSMLAVPPSELLIHSLTLEESGKVATHLRMYLQQMKQYIREQKEQDFPGKLDDIELDYGIREMHKHMKAVSNQNIRYFTDITVGPMLEETLKIVYGYMKECIQEKQFREILKTPEGLFIQ